MLCCIEELREKDVINVCDGENLGYVDDVREEKISEIGRAHV